MHAQMHISGYIVVTAWGCLMVRWTQIEPAQNINNIHLSSFPNPHSTSFEHNTFPFPYLVHPVSSLQFPLSLSSEMGYTKHSHDHGGWILCSLKNLNKRSSSRKTWGHALKCCALPRPLQQHFSSKQFILYEQFLIYLHCKHPFPFMLWSFFFLSWDGISNFFCSLAFLEDSCTDLHTSPASDKHLIIFFSSPNSCKIPQISQSNCTIFCGQHFSSIHYT